jgi:TonB family protein
MTLLGIILLSVSLAPPQSTQEYLQHLIGQRLILRHHAGSSNSKVEEKGHGIKKGDCDQAVEVMNVAYEKAGVRLQLRNIGTPVVGNKSVDCSLEPSLSLEITDFDIDQPLERTEKTIEGLLQTPDSYLAELGIPWQLPRSSENEVPIEASRPGLTAVKPLLLVRPGYTEEDRKARIKGMVTINCVVGTDGLVHDAVVTQGLSPGLNKNALDALTLWRFQPARVGDHFVAVKIPIELKYKLY